MLDMNDKILKNYKFGNNIPESQQKRLKTRQEERIIKKIMKYEKKEKPVF